MDFSEYIQACLSTFEKIKHNLYLVIVANKESSNSSSYTINETMDYLLKLCIENDVTTDFYTNEDDFIKFIQEKSTKIKKNIFVYNRMSDGIWGARRVFIPTICTHYQIPYFGHNSYVMGILCNKSHYTGVLKEFNVPTPKSWTYDSQYGWFAEEPSFGKKVIVKPIYENNSTSISKKSILIYNTSSQKLIHEISLKFQQPIIVQEFIAGYELSIPIFHYKNQAIIPRVIASKWNGQLKYDEHIISENLNVSRRYFDIKDKYYDFNSINPDIVKNIITDCKKIVKIVGIKSISRFDLRVDTSFNYYFNDLGSIPGFLPKSTFEYIFKEHGYTYKDFLKCSLVADYIKYYST